MPTPENLKNKQLTTYSFTRSPWYDSGLCPMPAGDSDTDVSFARLHAPIRGEAISWTAVSEGGPPDVPSPFGKNCIFGLNDNQVYIKQALGLMVPMPMAIPKITKETVGVGRAHTYTMSGTYYYSYKKAGTPTDAIPLGKLPYQEFDLKDNTFPAENFKTGILDDTMTNEPEEPPFENPILGP